MTRWGTAKKIITCRGYPVALLLKADGTLRYSPATVPEFRDNTTAGLGTVPGLPALQDAQCSTRHCLARAQDGSTWAWGDNADGQLGDRTSTGRTLPVEVQGLNPGMLRTHIPGIISQGFSLPFQYYADDSGIVETAH
jgi:Regulator of chromosome condensation (RCC1) repeat